MTTQINTLSREQIISKIKEYTDYKNKNVIVVYPNAEVKKRVFVNNSGEIGEYRKGSNRRGFKLEINEIIDIKPIKTTPESVKWEKSINKAILLLRGSGLWEDVLKDLEIAKKIGFDKLKEACNIENTKYSEDYNENSKIAHEKLRDFEPKLVYEVDDEHGKRICVKTTILWTLSRPLKIKKMNFGKYNNELVLNKIAEALRNKQKYHSGRFIVNYDVSFEYDGENKAWYSEEYRNCGNGHYYLALNGEYAVFWEDD